MPSHPEFATSHLLSPQQNGHQGLHLPLLAPASAEQRLPSSPRRMGTPSVVVPCHGGCGVEAVATAGAVGAAGGRRGAAVGSKVTVTAGGGERSPERDEVPMEVSPLGVPVLSHPEAPVGRRAGPRQAGRMQDRPGLRIALGWEEEEGWGFLCDASSSSYPALPGSTCDTGTLRVPPAPPLSRTPIPSVTAPAAGCTRQCPLQHPPCPLPVQVPPPPFPAAVTSRCCQAPSPLSLPAAAAFRCTSLFN